MESREIENLNKRLKKEIFYTKEAIKLTSGDAKKELEDELDFYNKIELLLQSLLTQKDKEIEALKQQIANKNT